MRHLVPSSTRSIVPSILLLCTMCAACTKNQRRDTLRASLVTVSAAADGFFEWDAKHQIAIVDQVAKKETEGKLTRAEARAETQAALEAYRKNKETVTFAINQVLKFIAVAATQNDDPSLATALKAAAELINAITNFRKRHDQSSDHRRTRRQFMVAVAHTRQLDRDKLTHSPTIQGGR